MTLNLRATLWVELLKARRSRVPLLTIAGFGLAPFAGGFFMIVMKDPELARRMGIISAKAQIMAGSADWPTYLGFMAQATAVGGLVVFAFIASWVFGREYSDGTVKDLLALPTARSVLVVAKFVVILLWSAVVAVVAFLLALAVGAAIILPGAAASVYWQGAVVSAVTALMTIGLSTPIAFFASAGRGYLPPMGIAILVLALAQVVAAAGWGEYFPWAVPALYAGLAGTEQGQLKTVSYLIVCLVTILGAMVTLLWWELADETN